MPPVGFEPTISAGKRPQTHALDRAATGTGKRKSTVTKMARLSFMQEYDLQEDRQTDFTKFAWFAVSFSMIAIR